jgi:lipoic acid synthetase
VKRYFPGILTKSGLMLGLGEEEEEVLAAAEDLVRAGCEILTLGQYLPPSENHLKLAGFIPPEVFRRLADRIGDMGFREVYAGPYVRSSYHADKTYDQAAMNPPQKDHFAAII